MKQTNEEHADDKTGTPPAGAAMMHDQRFTNVAELVESMTDDGDSFAQEFRQRVRSREVVKALQTMRIANETSQAEMAEALGCTQGRISKLENGFDADLKFRDVEAYARVLGRGVRLHFSNSPNETALDRIKDHAFCIQHELVQLAKLAHKDHEIAKGVVDTFAEVLINQVNLLQTASKQLPLLPDCSEPCIHVVVEVRKSIPPRPARRSGRANLETENRVTSVERESPAAAPQP